MTTEAAPAVDVRRLFGHGEPQNLLVLTDADRGGRNALALPFRDATVIELNAEDTIDVEGHFDAVVIDRSSYDPGWLDSITDSVVAALRPGGRVIVTLQPGRNGVPTTKPAACTGLTWQCLGILGGQPCAVLHTSEPSDADSGTTGLLLTTAETAVWLSAAQALDGHSELTARRAIVQHLENRRRSERALLLQLAAQARELDQERRRQQGVALVRTVLRRSKAGRGLIRVLRPLWRVARNLRNSYTSRHR